MAKPTQPLRDEHKELLSHVEHLRTVADSIGTASGALVQQGVDEAYRFLKHHLMVHAQYAQKMGLPLLW